MTSHYQKRIIAATGCTETEAKGVEAHLRADLGTLDTLSLATLNTLARDVIRTVRHDPALAADLAASYGL